MAVRVYNSHKYPNPSKQLVPAMKRPIIIPKNSKQAKKKDKNAPPTFVDEREDFDFLFERKYGKFLCKPKSLENKLPELTPEL